MKTRDEEYRGFELGPIRPPSESESLLLRITRNCPWNRCRFCGLYAGEKFTVRRPDHVKRDIDRIAELTDSIRDALASHENSYAAMRSVSTGLSEPDRMALFMAYKWLESGQQSVFLQDADSMMMRPADLADVLTYLRVRFPSVKRITTYGRSRTISVIKDENLIMLRKAGLTRVHTGMESGCDAVLDFVLKGTSRKHHINAGQKIKAAGIELSEYYMPGLGGRGLTERNARETAEVINEINPDYIRLRTLAVPEYTELYGEMAEGRFDKCSDIESAREILMFLENLRGITSTVQSDHILNLFQEVAGKLPEDAEKMKVPLYSFFEMNPEDQLLYTAGRRAGVFNSLADMDNQALRRHAENTVKAHGVTHENLDDFCTAMMARFI